jgi:hypothetical protein
MTGTRPAGHLDAALDHAQMLLMAERRRFAGRADRHEPLVPSAICHSTNSRKRFFVEGALLREWRHQRCDRPLEHEMELRSVLFRRRQSRNGGARRP